MEGAPLRVAFCFMPMAGHTNPSFPVARSLLAKGHQVHYFTHESIRPAVESTGAVFHSVAAYHAAYSEKRYQVDSQIRLFAGLIQEHGLKEGGTNTGFMMLNISKVSNLAVELQLPGTLAFLDEVRPHVVVYDAMLICRDALFAARMRGIPAVSLLTVAGPGAYADHMTAGVAHEAWVSELEGFAPHVAATRRLNEKYGLGLPVVEPPLLMLSRATTHLVTTSESLQDPMYPELAQAYKAQGATFAFVGPLLDETEGAVRLGMAKGKEDAGGSEVLAAAREAKAAGRRIVIASMGTLLTSNLPGIGEDGRPRGLCGRELCQGAWGGLFDAFGAASASEGPLLIVSLGNRADALDGLARPPNALCPMGLPQVDLLRLGVDLFVTHGGQNSFMESMSNGTPVVVCPGFGDQIVNATKAKTLGVGLPVYRPDPDAGMAAEAAAEYRVSVRRAAAAVMGAPAFGQAAGRVASELKQAGGVPGAVQVLLDVAAARPTAFAGDMVARGS